MTNKLFMLGTELAQNFPRPTGNLQRDFLIFQKAQNLILDLCQVKNEDVKHEEINRLLILLLQEQKGFLEQMLYAD